MGSQNEDEASVERVGVDCYMGQTLFSGMGSWANEPRSVGESSDFCDEFPTGIRAAMADISPVWLSTVMPGRSDVWLKLSGMAPIPRKSWTKHFLNCLFMKT